MSSVETVGAVPRMRTGRRPYPAYTGLAGAAAALLFAGALVALHWLRPDISIVDNYVSEFANGPYGALFSVPSFVHGIGNLAIAAGLWTALAGAPLGRLGAVLFGLSAIGILVAALFSADASGAPPTLSGQVHLMAAFSSFAVEGVALLLFVRSFARLPSWRGFAATTGALMAVGSAALVLLLVFRAAGQPPGIAERVALVAFLGWEFLASVRIWRQARRRVPSARDRA